MFRPKLTGAKGARESLNWPEAGRKIWPDHLTGGIGGGGGAELLQGALTPSLFPMLPPQHHNHHYHHQSIPVVKHCPHRLSAVYALPLKIVEGCVRVQMWQCSCWGCAMVQEQRDLHQSKRPLHPTASGDRPTSTLCSHQWPSPGRWLSSKSAPYTHRHCSFLLR